MSKPVRILVLFLLIDAVALGVYFGAKALRSRSPEDPAEGYEWTTLDAATPASTELEQAIKTDYEEKGLLPIKYRNYGRAATVLRQFRGSKLAGSGVSVLEMTFQGLEDWAVVDLWVKGDDDRDIRRTVLYVLTGGAWKVGDSGRLEK